MKNSPANAVRPGPVLLSLGMLRLKVMLEKGNVWYVRNYEQEFSGVHFAYLIGAEPACVTEGATNLWSLGGGSRWVDLILAPWRAYRCVRRLNPDVIITPDLVFSWWTTWLIRHLLGRRIALIPLSIPEQIYADGGGSLSGVPLFVERLMTRLCFNAADTVVTSRSLGAYVDWLSGSPQAKRKLLVLDTLVDELPSQSFYERMMQIRNAGVERSDQGLVLIYVGRLHHEKLVDDLIEMMCLLAQQGLGAGRVKLRLVGDGPDRELLQARARQLGVAEQVEFLGAIPNQELPAWLMSSDVFVSPLTGSSLREAAVCGLSIVAYDRDWLHGFLRHEVHALLVESRDVKGLAMSVQRLAQDPALRDGLKAGARELGARHWMPHSVRESLHRLSLHMQREGR